MALQLHFPTQRTFAALGLALALPCAAELPPQNLELSFRQIDSEQAVREPSAAVPAHADVTVSTRRPLASQPWLQQLQVLNGEWAALRIGRSLPVPWTRAVAGQASAPAKVGSAAGGVSGGVVNELTWLQAGQSLAVRARWPGGNNPALVDIRVDMDDIDDRRANDMPATSQSQVVTTLAVPLERWTTFASSQSGREPDARGTTSTSALQGTARQLFQVFVHLP
jgi:hypothetical protein